MAVKWNKLVINLLIWAIAEIALNFIGLDTLADYSEFIFDRHPVIQLDRVFSQSQIFLIHYI